MIVLRLLLSLLFLAAAAAAALSAWARYAVPEQPAAVRHVWPDFAPLLIDEANALFRSPASSPGALTAKSRQLLLVFPVSETPLVLAGASAAAQGRIDEVVRNFEAARRRQPRSVPALTWITANDVQTGNYARALANLEILKRLNPEGQAVYAETAAAIAAEPGGQEPFRAALFAKQPVALQALTLLNRDSDDFGLLLALNVHDPARAGVVIQRLQAERGAETAFIAWLSLLPSIEAASLQWPYDGAFVGVIAPPPFSWTISREAELQQAGGLYISYPGSASAKPVFARQTMLVGPGRYVLQADMEGETSKEGAHFEWTISCLDPELRIALLPVEELVASIQVFSTDFEVPPGCPAQEIRLLGKPGVFPVRARTVVRQVKIRPAEDQP